MAFVPIRRITLKATKLQRKLSQEGPASKRRNIMDMIDFQAVSAAETCAQDLRRYDYDRWLAALMAPPAFRQGLMALYAFNSELARVREQVSQPILGLMRQQWWREGLEEARQGLRRSHPVFQALPQILLASKDAEQDLELLFKTREQDMEEVPILDWGDWHSYTQGTGGVLMRLALRLRPILSSNALQAADAMGTAYAMIGLIRALPSHLEQQRIYLPRAAFAQAGLRIEDAQHPENPAALKRLVKTCAQYAHDKLEDAQYFWPSLDREERLLLRPRGLAKLYLAQLIKADFEIESPRLYPGPLMKVIALWCR